MYCSPHLSTTWEEDIVKNGPYDVLDKDGNKTKHNDIEYLRDMMPIKGKQADNPYVQAFWEWWPKLYKKLEVFRVTGGEPLMDVNTFKVIDYIYKHPNAWLEMSVTTNMCPPKTELMDKFIDKVKKLEDIQIWQDKERFNPSSGNHWYVNMALKHFSLFVSVDSVGDHAEYIRNGLDFNLMKSNISKFMNNTVNTNLTFINTFNALSIPRIKEFMQYVLEVRREFSREKQGIKYIPIVDPHNTHPDYIINPRQRVWFDIPLLRNPEWQSIQILPKSYDRYIEEAITFMADNLDKGNFVGFYDFEIDKLERNLTIMQDKRMNNVINRTNFIKYFKQYDTRKGSNLLETFPEFIEYVGEDYK